MEFIFLYNLLDPIKSVFYNLKIFYLSFLIIILFSKSDMEEFIIFNKTVRRCVPKVIDMTCHITESWQ